MEVGANRSGLKDFIRSLSAAADRHPALDVPVLMVFGGGYALGWLIDPLTEAARRLRAALAPRRESVLKSLAVVVSCALLVTAAVPAYRWVAGRQASVPVEGTSALTEGENILVPGAGVTIDTSAPVTKPPASSTSPMLPLVSEPVSAATEPPFTEPLETVLSEEAIPKTGPYSLVPLVLLLGAAGVTAAMASGPGTSDQREKKEDEV